VFESEAEHQSQWAAICSIALNLGMSHETLRNWVRQAERDRGLRPGPSTNQVEELKQLKAENAELRRANEILKSAALGPTGQRNGVVLFGLTVGGGHGQVGSSGDVRRTEAGAVGPLERWRIDQRDQPSDGEAAWFGVHDPAIARWCGPSTPSSA